jgi:3-oxoacyl-[acyl-carrier protein] reductase
MGPTQGAALRACPHGKNGKPEEVASVVDFLVSDRAAYITGQIIHPNGGWVMW